MAKNFTIERLRRYRTQRLGLWGLVAAATLISPDLFAGGDSRFDVARTVVPDILYMQMSIQDSNPTSNGPITPRALALAMRSRKVVTKAPKLDGGFKMNYYYADKLTCSEFVYPSSYGSATLWQCGFFLNTTTGKMSPYIQSPGKKPVGAESMFTWLPWLSGDAGSVLARDPNGNGQALLSLAAIDTQSSCPANGPVGSCQVSMVDEPTTWPTHTVFDYNSLDYANRAQKPVSVFAMPVNMILYFMKKNGGLKATNADLVCGTKVNGTIQICSMSY